ncbi:MAG: ribose-phosphate pyrophosphokinase [Bacillota bacterium]
MHRRLKVFSGRSHPELSVAIGRYLRTELGRVQIFKFKNDNTFVKIEENVRETDVFVVQTSCPPVDEHLMELLIMVDALKRASAARITAVMPLFPYARSDQKDQPRIPITARLVADLLATAGANRVITVDLHASQIQGFFTIPLDHLTAQGVLVEYFKKKQLPDLVVVATDSGGARRATSCARRLGTDLALMDKRRIGNEQRVEINNVIGEVHGRPALVFEDEIETGGSLVAAVEVLKARGAGDIYVACPHPVLAGNAAERLAGADIKEVVVADTVPVPESKRIPKLKVLSVAHILGEAIRRTHNGESISSLFE